ncbi:hypothetical protein [Pseudomonas lundensis]|uniref:hypothetical protein n=1 Tax=Pseudomonas lundensis TaxID=86185 RepID=UPI0030B96033
MADYSELKKLAQSLNRAIEQAQHKPGQWAETTQSMGGICCAGEPFQIGKPWAKEEPWAHFSFKRDSWLAVAAVNALPKLMALIAENEALNGPHDWLAEDLIKELVDNAQSFQDNSDHGESDPFAIVLLAAASRIRRQEVSIERYRAENAGLKTGYEAYEQVNAGLKAEVEWLRKDSESYRLLSFCHGQGALELVRSHHELCAEIRRLKIIAGEPVPPTPEELIGPSPEGPTARIRRKLAAMGKGMQS